VHLRLTIKASDKQRVRTVIPFRGHRTILPTSQPRASRAPRLIVFAVSDHAPNAFQRRQMCIVLFLKWDCPCPPVPLYPYLRLCPAARSQNPVKACPQGRRLSQTVKPRDDPGPCQWCITCAREKGREERREWVKSRLGAQGREHLRKEGIRDAMERLESARERESVSRRQQGQALGYGGTSRTTYSPW
jgi:hypothetical protein